LPQPEQARPRVVEEESRERRALDLDLGGFRVAARLEVEHDEERDRCQPEGGGHDRPDAGRDLDPRIDHPEEQGGGHDAEHERRRAGGRGAHVT
jgi:hypothetical protein